MSNRHKYNSFSLSLSVFSPGGGYLVLELDSVLFNSKCAGRPENRSSGYLLEVGLFICTVFKQEQQE